MTPRNRVTRVERTPVETIKHLDERANIPTNELRGMLADDERSPGKMLYPRDPSLDPQLVWKGKDEQDAADLEVPVVPIYIQEKVHPRVIVENLRKTATAGEPEPELTLFDDFNGLDFEQLVDFYNWGVKWANRLILGDSLLVMTSLAEKERLRGKVQTIYLDPPYGIRFGSNWQVSTRRRDVKDGKFQDATRQPEQIRAFRDTWELGIHSYLAYLRDRFVVARELLSDSGSIFVQIGDENVHLVRCALDEVFGSENFVNLITFKKTTGAGSFAGGTTVLASVADYLLWYARDPPKRSTVHTFTFPPEQQHHLGVGDEVVDPVTGESAGTISRLDSDGGELDLVRGPKLDGVPLPRALIPGGPYDTRAQGAALVRLAQSIRDGDARYPALESVIRREVPLGGARVQRSSLAEIQELVLGLDGTHLFVQGPPGSGKTWTGARVIVRLLAQEKRVGVSSTSHKAIHNLLDEVEEAAEKAGVEFRGIKKCSADNPESVYEGRFIGSTEKLDPFLDPEVGLVAGTAWLFARPQLDSALDYLFIDEAGQVSLADALAVGTSARTLVLLGDPLQLAQVTQGMHPAGTGVSVLEHLLGEHQTTPEDRGLFLEHTWRMHPDVCAFISDAFYERRLFSAPGRERQATAFGTGIGYLPVEHTANRQFSHEEAERIRDEITAMLGGDYTDVEGAVRPLAEDDFMVVAPYNWQVRVLKERLPAGVRVGTVDKFQGQEAPVVFFSMASSSGEDIPHGLEFLFSRNRLNVAISRARCLAFLVASPKLLETKCRTIEQMRLVNALCRFVELAGCDTTGAPEQTPASSG